MSYALPQMVERFFRRFRRRSPQAALRQRGSILPAAFTGFAPLDLGIMGRVVLQSALVGLVAGALGALFFFCLEHSQVLLLERVVGYVPLRAHGEAFAESGVRPKFRPWLLVVLPAVGGLLCGWVVNFAREARGGGGDATIEAFHHRGGIIRPRVIWVKSVASLLTLGTGGAGGREGPTMLIGGALGSLVGRVLQVNARERRILLVAGVAAGIAAVFRTPLGAALLAVEFLYKDGFESDALIPSVLASVVSYSVVISLFGHSTLFGQVGRFPFVVTHLPLYAVLAVIVAIAGVAFVRVLHAFRRLFQRLPGPTWLRPAVGGLALGIFATPVIVWVGHEVGVEGQGLGLLGGGYGAVQMAISGSRWLPGGWLGVQLLVLLAIAKLLAASLTIGSEGSAGDFAPSLAIGGLLGGAFGRAAALLLDDPRIEPSAFALVGMGALYGGIAHVPLSALILVCELAGNYDLLVPLMLTLGISIAAIRRTSLYDAQVASQMESPVHRNAFILDVLQGVYAKDVLPGGRAFATFSATTPASKMLSTLAESDQQDVFPVVDGESRLVGLVTAGALKVMAVESDGMKWMIATDLMQPPVSVALDSDLKTVSARLVSSGLRAVPVTDDDGRVVSLLDEMDIAHWHRSVQSGSVRTPLPGGP
jgi:CIC family chloride channel protein